jgi:hypoxanthine phosphoribosyltransferase
MGCIGELTINGIESLQIENQDVLIIDDIFDTGFTMKSVMDSFEQQHPKSLKSLVLLVKNVERSIAYRPDYVLFDIDNHFVIGYGLDYKEHFRGLPGISYFKGDRPPEKLN